MGLVSRRQMSKGPISHTFSPKIMLQKLVGFSLLTLFAHATAVDSQIRFNAPQVSSNEFLDTQTLNKVLNFLVADINVNGSSGCAYTATSGVLAGKLLPLSFWTAPEYFGDFVCKYGATAGGEPPNCHVRDIYDPETYGVGPEKGLAGDMQLERTNIHGGINIYDASVWQISMALAGVKLGREDLLDHSRNVDLMLKAGHLGDGEVAPNSWRAVTKADGTFTYNGVSINATEGFEATQAYAYRMWPRQWLTKDPFYGTRFESYITPVNFPVTPGTKYERGRLSWQDYKPITGENSWALFIGPLQAQYLRDVTHAGNQCVKFDSDAVQNAIGALTAVMALQSKLGAIYYVPAGSLGNIGSQPANRYAVSTENNASLLSGLLILRKLLQDTQSFGCKYDSDRLEHALSYLQVLISGGENPLHKHESHGMLTFFSKYAYDSERHILRTGGLVCQPGQPEWQPYTHSVENPQAIDVNTWGITALGVPFMDYVIGEFGSSFRAWEVVKSFGGFSVNGELYGVGYSAEDHNGPASDPADGVMSGEWTFGAINFVRTLKYQYRELLKDEWITNHQRSEIASIVKTLNKDELSMLKHVRKLQSDKYPHSSTFASHRPRGDWNSLVKIQDDQVAFLYASKRYFIPFGWFANPIPAASSTAWAVMVQYDYNPFSLGGSYNSMIELEPFERGG